MNTLTLNLVLLILYGQFIRASEEFDHEVTVEEEFTLPDCHIQCGEDSVQGNKRTRTPEDQTTVDEDAYAVPVDCSGQCIDNSRGKRRVPRSPKSRVVEAMLNTPMLHLNPGEPDVFAILRDQYDLPKRKSPS